MTDDDMMDRCWRCGGVGDAHAPGCPSGQWCEIRREAVRLQVASILAHAVEMVRAAPPECFSASESARLEEVATKCAAIAARCRGAA